MKNKKLLAVIIVVIIFIVSVTIFAFIYHSYNKDDPDPEKRSLVNAFYTSVTIQTTIGLSDPPNTHIKSLQVWVIVQSVITYIIGLGIIFILVESLSKEDNTIELRIEKDLSEMKKMMLELHGYKIDNKKSKKI